MRGMVVGEGGRSSGVLLYLKLCSFIDLIVLGHCVVSEYTVLSLANGSGLNRTEAIVDSEQTYGAKD